MSISPETLKQQATKPAVLCCRTEKGTTLTADHFEDPAIFDDLIDSGLLRLDESVLTLEEAVGATLTSTSDALVAITPELVEGYQPKAKATKPVEATPIEETTSGMVRVHIGKGENITLEFPVGAMPSAAPVPQTPNNQEPKLLRSLTKKHYPIDEVVFGDETKIDGKTLVLRRAIAELSLEKLPLVKKFSLDIITPKDYGQFSQTIMDVQPIATKQGEDKLGTGVTRVLDGVVFVVTGTDEDGVQIGEFGSSEGELDRNIMWNRPGCPDEGDILIKAEVVIAKGTGMERPGPLAAHKACDQVVQEIRQAMKQLDDSLVSQTEELEQYRRPGKKKVVIVKEIMGQGAMHDNLILPFEPVGVIGAKPNIDLGNLPVMLSPLELLDGGIHALTCIGPASKENSRHYWREPLVLEVMKDDALDLCGVIMIGSPQINSEKFYVSDRLGMLLEAMDLDGAFITTEGFGNNHIDFAAHHEQAGSRGIPVVGFTFSAVQGALVTGNQYMNSMIDLNKSEQGIENEILGNNTLCHEDALRGIAMLKAVMNGEEVKPAERRFTPGVKQANLQAVEDELGRDIERVKNEQVLEKSLKRRTIYEVEA